MMNIDKNSLVGALVAQDYRLATVFKKFGIDFCCGGNRSLELVCQESGNSTDEVITALQAALNAGGKPQQMDYASWPADLLVDYIEKIHHRYVHRRIPEIQSYLEKIVQVHGTAHPELSRIKALFEECATELTQHMRKEEGVLFPFIREVFGKGNQEPQALLQLQQPIRVMMREHDTEGARFREIASLSCNYTPPSDACNTYRVTYALLQEFESDLHLHIHLENNILFAGILSNKLWEHPFKDTPLCNL